MIFGHIFCEIKTFLETLVRTEFDCKKKKWKFTKLKFIVKEKEGKIAKG